MIDARRLRKLFHYDPNTGIFIRLSRNCIAGSKDTKGAIQIWIDGERYFAHRLAWLYVKGVWPPIDIDHKDRVKSNNRWNNLRLATHSQNRANGHSTPTKGTFRDGAGWSAKVRKGGKVFHRSYHKTQEAARAAYVKAAKEAFGEYANP